jgi:prevent-host-death family protein
MDSEPRERSARDAREHFADVLNDAIRGHITYITSHARQVAAVVPLTELADRYPVDDHEYDEGYEAARRGDWAPAEVTAQSPSWQLGHEAGRRSILGRPAVTP